jgi:hypothetical protein
MLAFSKRSRRRFSVGEEKGTSMLWARMWVWWAACGDRKGCSRILQRVGRSSASERIEEIKLAASGISRGIEGGRYLVIHLRVFYNLVSLLVISLPFHLRRQMGVRPLTT